MSDPVCRFGDDGQGYYEIRVKMEGDSHKQFWYYSVFHVSDDGEPTWITDFVDGEEVFGDEDDGEHEDDD